MAVQPDGKILIAGAFGSCNGADRSRVARLNGDPCTAPTFTACPNTTVSVGTTLGQCNAAINYTITASGTPSPTLTCAFTVTVGDGHNPSIVCPPSISCHTDANQCMTLCKYLVAV